MLTEVNKTTAYDESLNNLESDKWLDSMKLEIDSMYTNQLWTLVEPPEGIKPIGCKWIFKKRTGMEGNVITYKAKLIAKGYHQRQGIDCGKAVNLLCLNPKGVLLAIVIHYDYDMWKMDVKMAFRKGNLSKDVCITQSEVFTPRNGNKVCKLQISIYGLKQASRSWYIRFDETIKEFSFSQNVDEAYVNKKVSGSAIVFLVLYVDD